MRYDGLTRDRIPEIVDSSGKRAITRTAGDTEYLDYLRRKLLEEVHEYMTSGDVDELAGHTRSSLGAQALDRHVAKPTH